MEMCRFSSRLDPGYVQVGGELINMVESVRQEQLEPQTISEHEPESKESKFLCSDNFLAKKSITLDVRPLSDDEQGDPVRAYKKE